MKSFSIPPAGVLALALTTAGAGCGGGADAPKPTPPPPPAATWTYYASAAWPGSSLTISIPPGKSAAVFVLNTGPAAIDNVPATVSVAGTSPAAIAPAAAEVMTAEPAAHRPQHPLPDRAVQATEGTLPAALLVAAPAAVGPPPDTTSFCVQPGGAPPATRRAATLAGTTASALFYVDDADAAALTVPDLTALGNSWETTIHPTVTGLFGQPADTDANGRVTILLTSAVMGPRLMVGAYNWVDQAFAADTSPGCTGAGISGGSNGADLLVVTTPSALAAATGWASARVTAELVGTMAHEFQHMISFNLHCAVRAAACSADLMAGTPTEDVWLNEAMSTVAEDAVGMGWATALTDAVSSMQQYMLLAPASGRKGYSQVGMAVFESDPVGNYQGVHSFLRYFVDRRGSGLLAALSGNPATGNALKGRANLEAALGTTFEAAMADYATAVAFSNAGLDPRFDYTCAAWTPFHQKFGVLEAVAVNPGASATASLRKDGWNAFITGAGVAGGGTLTVTSGEPVKPGVVVVLH